MDSLECGTGGPGGDGDYLVSRDNGGSWEKIATNVNAAARAYFWQILEPDNRHLVNPCYAWNWMA